MIRRLLVRSRPRFWLYLAGPVLVGLAHGAGSTAELLTPTSVVLVLYFLVPANVFLYGINDVFDASIDRGNPKKGDRELAWRGDRLTVLAIAGSAALGLGLVVWLPPTAAPWLLGFLVLGAAYSAPPFRLKTRPPLDSISNGLYVLPGAAAFAAMTGTAPPLLVLLGAWLWTMGMHTFSAVPDIDPDRRGGIETLATLLGPRWALAYCAVTWTAAALAFGLVDGRAGSLLLIYPLVAVGLVRSEVPVPRAYWWFPAINAVVGATFTVAGLWGLVHG